MVTLLPNISHSSGATTEFTPTPASATLGKCAGEEYGPGLIHPGEAPLDEATGFSRSYVVEGKHKIPAAPAMVSRVGTRSSTPTKPFPLSTSSHYRLNYLPQIHTLES